MDNNRVLALAIVKLLEILGEAASGVSDSFKGIHQDLPWKQMIGMRNRLIHGYFDVDLDVVWQTIHVDLPPLKEQLEDIFEN
ncbi:MAG: HepT-like ribonuclease domain-containing protein [Candidatus Thorarchaeota archaeon]